MSAIIRSSMLDFLATAHAITGFFGYNGIGACKIRYAVNLVM